MSNRPTPARSHPSRHRRRRPPMADSSVIDVTYLEYRGDDPLNVAESCGMGIALDQRRFGTDQLLVALLNGEGEMHGLYYTQQTDPPEEALIGCLDVPRRPGLDPVAAIAYSDEPVEYGPLPADLADRFTMARGAAAVCGVHLVDWIQCGDDKFRSMKMATDPDASWWDGPTD